MQETYKISYRSEAHSKTLRQRKTGKLEFRKIIATCKIDNPVKTYILKYDS